MKELSLEERKKIGLDILLDFDAVCKKNGIAYYLAYGTLLGAVRHKGFIPWDDDIDVWVNIHDYEKLLDILKQESKYQVESNLESKRWVNWFSKLMDPATLVMDAELSPYERLGIAVDIFPIFECKKNKRWTKKLRLCQTMIFRIHEYIDHHAKVTGVKDFIKKILVVINVLVGRDINFWRERIKRMQIEDKGTGLIGAPLSGHDKDIHDRGCFSSQTLLEFEHYMFPAPVGYKNVLANIFGDYMQLPPPEQRHSNHAEKAFRLEEV